MMDGIKDGREELGFGGADYDVMDGNDSEE